MVKTGPNTIFEDLNLVCWQDYFFNSSANYTEEQLYDLKNKLNYIINADVFKPSEEIPDYLTFDLIKKFSQFSYSFLEPVICSYDTIGKYTFDYINQWIEPIITNYYQMIFDANQEYNNP